MEQEIIKINTHYTPAQANNENGAPAAEKGPNKEIEPNSSSAAVTRGKRKFHQNLLNPVDEDHHRIGLLQAHVAAMTIVPTVGDQDSTSGLSVHFGNHLRRRKIAHSDPVRWKIKSEQLTLNEQQYQLQELGTGAPIITIEQQLQALQAPPIRWCSPVYGPLAHTEIDHHAGGGNSPELGVNAPNINMAIHHVAPALPPAPAPAPPIIDLVITVSSSSTDQLQNSRSAAAPPQLDPVVFEPGFLPWDQVEMPDEAFRRDSGLRLYPSLREDY